MKHSVLQVYNRIYICMVNQHTTVHKCLNVNKIEAISTQASPYTSTEGWPWTQLELFHSWRLKHPELSLGFQQQHIHGSSAPDKLQYLLLSFLGLHLLQATSTIVKARDQRAEGKEVTKADSKTVSSESRPSNVSIGLYKWGNLLHNNGGSYRFLANPHNHQSSAEAQTLETLSQE